MLVENPLKSTVYTPLGRQAALAGQKTFSRASGEDHGAHVAPVGHQAGRRGSCVAGLPAPCAPGAGADTREAFMPAFFGADGVGHVFAKPDKPATVKAHRQALANCRDGGNFGLGRVDHQTARRCGQAVMRYMAPESRKW